MVYYIEREDLHRPGLLQQLYADMDHHYYWSDDFSEAMYIDLAEAGFVCVSTMHEGRLLLLGEIQKAYAFLKFDEIHVGKNVARLLKRADYRLAFNTAFDDVIAAIQAAHENCWMVGEYADLMRKLKAGSYKDFRLFSTELYDAGQEKLVAGEIGYVTSNGVYTSLTGFHNRERAYRNWGTLQLVLLGRHLQESGLRFWNLGHPYMKYKTDLGARTVSRAEFLGLWYAGVAVRPRI
jgi:Leu/Phe-tRNA-protein transferase